MRKDHQLLGSLALVALALLLAACDLGTVSPLTPVPASYTQKILVEEFTGTWCGFCPDGAYQLQQLIEEYPGVVLGVAYHWSDPYEPPGFADLTVALGGIAAVPMGMVNRNLDPSTGMIITWRTDWASEVDTALQSRQTNLGLKLSSTLTDDALEVTVTAGFGAETAGEVRLAVLVAEDGVVADQANYHDGDANSPFYGLGDPIPGYVHEGVVRQYLTSSLGDTLGTGPFQAGSSQIRTFRTTIPAGWNHDHLRLVAFLCTDGKYSAQHHILNAQQAQVGEAVPWD